MESFQLTEERLSRWHQPARTAHSALERSRCGCCQCLDGLGGWETVARWLERRGFTILRSDPWGIVVGCAGFQDCNALYHTISDRRASY
jgi:hypothetical protein